MAWLVCLAGVVLGLLCLAFAARMEHQGASEPVSPPSIVKVHVAILSDEEMRAAGWEPVEDEEGWWSYTLDDLDTP